MDILHRYPHTTQLCWHIPYHLYTSIYYPHNQPEIHRSPFVSRWQVPETSTSLSEKLSRVQFFGRWTAKNLQITKLRKGKWSYLSMFRLWKSSRVICDKLRVVPSKKHGILPWTGGSPVEVDLWMWHEKHWRKFCRLSQHVLELIYTYECIYI